MEDKREELDVEKDVNTPKKEELTKKQSLAAIFISILIVIVVVTAGVLVGLKEKKGPEEHYYKLNEKFNFYNSLSGIYGDLHRTAQSVCGNTCVC